MLEERTVKVFQDMLQAQRSTQKYLITLPVEDAPYLDKPLSFDAGDVYVGRIQEIADAKLKLMHTNLSSLYRDLTSQWPSKLGRPAQLTCFSQLVERDIISTLHLTITEVELFTRLCKKKSWIAEEFVFAVHAATERIRQEKKKGKESQ